MAYINLCNTELIVTEMLGAYIEESCTCELHIAVKRLKCAVIVYTVEEVLCRVI
jgi:hypothetical protein